MKTNWSFSVPPGHTYKTTAGSEIEAKAAVQVSMRPIAIEPKGGIFSVTTPYNPHKEYGVIYQNVSIAGKCRLVGFRVDINVDGGVEIHPKFEWF